jgi:hypothetical protein
LENFRKVSSLLKLFKKNKKKFNVLISNVLVVMSNDFDASNQDSSTTAVFDVDEAIKNSMDPNEVIARTNGIKLENLKQNDSSFEPT